MLRGRLRLSLKQLKDYQKRGYPKSVIQEATAFIKEKEAELLYLTLLSQHEYRIMWKDKTGQSEAKIFPII